MFKIISDIRTDAAQLAVRPMPFPFISARLTRIPRISSELCIVATSLFFTLFSNHHFWTAWAAGRDWSHAGTWLSAAAIGVLLTAIHSLLLGMVVTRHTAKPLLGMLFVVTSLAVYYMNRYTVFFDMNMVRSVVHTNTKEAAELISPNLLIYALAAGGLPALIASRLRFVVRPPGRALLVRAGFLLGMLLISIACTVLVFQDLSALLRNQKELRYLVTPANFIVSAVRLIAAEGAQAGVARIPVGADARLAGASHSKGKPLLLVLVVGETARAANWGLNGYARQTNPELSRESVINFPHTTSCGTNTEVSVPCMFSPFGRRNYDEKKIRLHESLLHVLEHSGIKTIWRDNQSGCKGVCDGLERQQLDDAHDPALCNGGHCLDEILLQDIEKKLAASRGPMVVVLHQLGNHGPAYSRRHPARYGRFSPACQTGDLGKCTREEIVNSYDNALLYTDHFLAETIHRLQAQQSHHAAMIYVSDHGESLGENGIYLHGMPYAFAPRVQTEVPMVMWLSKGFVSNAGINENCLKARALQPVNHDYLFHSVLGLMQVSTEVYDRAYDIAAGCYI